MSTPLGVRSCDETLKAVTANADEISPATTVRPSTAVKYCQPYFEDVTDDDGITLKYRQPYFEDVTDDDEISPVPLEDGGASASEQELVSLNQEAVPHPPDEDSPSGQATGLYESEYQQPPASTTYVEFYQKPPASTACSEFGGSIGESDESITDSEESELERTKPERNKNLTRECRICSDDVNTSQARRLECGHYYCKPCLERSFTIGSQIHEVVACKIRELPGGRSVLSVMGMRDMD
ncbi:Uu.00g131310.m01.CDS01 [Anthostomella pinea]|uniref:Uu.00g131310.m01.CDS01 n=1 Tax=Anthostomella pinea TaxID=933095 RepID=A0AAI8VDJ5_9PEZI|nr:Uu.00g131310.m01.CDS01 [Anthostomella pinea]